MLVVPVDSDWPHVESVHVCGLFYPFILYPTLSHYQTVSSLAFLLLIELPCIAIVNEQFINVSVF